MQPIYFCPGCGAQVAYGDRFCGNCGIKSSCVVQRITPQSHDYRYFYRQWEQYHQPPCEQASVPANLNQCQQRHVPDKDSNATPISSEISKLLAELFDERLKHSKA